MERGPQSSWPIARTVTRPLLQALQDSRNRHWYLFGIVLAATVACFIVAGAFIECEESAGNQCGPVLDAADVTFSMLGLLGLVLVPIALILALRSHFQYQRALAKDVDTPYH